VISVAIDAAGAPERIQAIVAGTALASLDPAGNLEVQVVGDERRITHQLVRMRHNPERLSVVHSGAENPVEDAVQLAADKVADALVITGPSGPALAACREILPLLPGVPKAAMSAVYPTVLRHGKKGGPFALLLDVGELALGLASYAQKQRLLWKIGVALLSGVLPRIKDLTGWEQYGGSPVLGFSQVILRAHPDSDGRAIHNACRVAVRAVAADEPRAFAELSGQSPKPAAA
jgi:fatty acid/phospholipid biosynthesis enzyme